MFRIIVIVGLLLSLTGCLSPTTLGLSEAEWQSYTPEQREKIKTGYHEVSNSQVTPQEEAGPLETAVLAVNIAGGTAKMPPFTQASEFKPIDFQVTNGSCKSVTLENINGKDSVNVKACFLGKSLFIDPSAYEVSKKVGSIRLHYSPIWDRGFTYQHVSSSGYAHLENVNVGVKIINDNPEQ